MSVKLNYDRLRIDKALGNFQKYDDNNNKNNNKNTVCSASGPFPVQKYRVITTPRATFMVQSLWHSHCVRSLGSLNECKSAYKRPPTFGRRLSQLPQVRLLINHITIAIYYYSTRQLIYILPILLKVIVYRIVG